jgi:hypothetical protein
MNYTEPEVRAFVIKVKSKLTDPQIQAWTEGVLSGDYATRDKLNFFDKRPKKAYDEVDRFKRIQDNLKSEKVPSKVYLGKDSLNTINGNQSMSAMTRMARSSTPWSIIVVLIVAATGLLWLLLKKRK